MTTARLGKLLDFAWRRWGAAERAVSRARSVEALRPAERRCAFWRALHNRVEAVLERVVAPQRLAHAAVARTNTPPVFTRPPDTDLPETFPDLPIPNLGVILRPVGTGGKHV